MKKEKRFPTIIGLIILIIGIAAGTVLSGRSTSGFKSKANSDCTPINPQVTNITNTTLDISFMTNAECLSNLIIDNRTITDIRFTASGKTPTPSKIHYFQVFNLKEDHEYTYTLILSGKSYVKPEYKLRTGKKPVAAVPLSDLAWGRVYTQDLKPAADSIVYLNIPGASPLSSFVTSNGHWNIPLATSFNQEKNNWFSPPLNVEEEIIVLNANKAATQITSNTNRNNPVPDIILGENQFSSLPVTGNIRSDSLIAGVAQKSLEIINPKEAEVLMTKKPDIFGNASFNSLVTLVIEPGSLSTNVTSEDDGEWHWYVGNELSPGDYIVTASSKNSRTGYVDTVSRKFTISQNASSLAFTASSSAQIAQVTPSPSPSPTLTPTPTLSPTPTITNTPTPSKSPSPTTTPSLKPSPTSNPTITLSPTPSILATTITPTSTVTIKPTNAIVSRPSTSSGVPVTGFTIPSAILSFVAVIFITAAIIF